MIANQSKMRVGIRPAAWLAVVGLIVVWFTVHPMSRAQSPGTTTQAQPASDAVQPEAPTAPFLPEAARAPADPKLDYGLWVLTPAVVAFLLAIFTRQMVPALVVGILVGAFMQLRCLPNDSPFAAQNTVVGGLRLAAEYYILGAIQEPPERDLAHIKIVIFTLVIGFVVGVLHRNGGAAGMVRVVAGAGQSPRRGALTAWLAGLVVFFDPYASCLIVGSSMRSAFDRLKLSRAKLAYIVDATAIPVASIALMGLWVGAEVGFIDKGLTGLAQPLRDAQGSPMTGMSAFLASIPYRFYPIFAVILVFLVCLTGRDFGPMKRSEREAQGRPQTSDTRLGDPTISAPAAPRARWWLGFFPILVLLLGTVSLLVVTGGRALDAAVAGSAQAADQAWWDRAGAILSHANPNMALFYAALAAAVVAVLLTVAARACPAREAVDAGLDGLARMMPTVVVLVLVWAISALMLDLQLGAIVAERLASAQFPAPWLPLAVFLGAAVVSFATGTSWATMAVLCPVTVDLSSRLMTGMEPATAITLVYSAVGSVLAGAVFGGHCSPISDTTVLSSIAAGCRHEEHVWTQMPYAIAGAVAQVALGNVLCGVYGQPWYVGLGAGTVFLALVVLIFGRRAVPVQQLGTL